LVSSSKIRPTADGGGEPEKREDVYFVGEFGSQAEAAEAVFLALTPARGNA